MPGTRTHTVAINRTAIDPSGNIGSLYDACRDQVLDSPIANHEGKSSPLHQVRRCEIVSGKKGDNPSLLQMVSIDDQSQLSLLLNLTEKKGVATIKDCSTPVNEYTRLFCCTYVERVQKLVDDVKDKHQIISRLKSHKLATHIITEVEWGIDVVVVLELPSIHDSVTEIQRVLKRMCVFLQCDYNTMPLGPDEKNILKRIISTRAFSNTNEIRRLSTLYDVCTYIQQNKNTAAKNPLSYGLQPITWLYPQHTDQGATFVPLTAELHQHVQQYLSRITSNAQKSTVVAREYLPKLLPKHLSAELSAVQKQCSDVQDKCMREVERFSRLVVGVRNGRVRTSEIDEALKDNEQMMMKKILSNLNQVLNDMIEKGHFINDLDRQHFQYINVAYLGVGTADSRWTIERRLITDAEHDRILCSNDSLNQNDPDRLRRLRNDLVEERKINPNLRLTYADFPHPSHELPSMIRLPSSLYDMEDNRQGQKETPSTRSTQDFASISTETKIRHSALADRHTTASTSTRAQFIDVLSTDIQTNGSLSAASRTPFPVTKVKETPALTVTNSQTYALSQGKIQPSPPSPTRNSTYVEVPKDVPTHPSPSSETTIQRLSEPLSDNEVINILLLGETGVGKSTFINAFANYLTFDTLKQAEKGQAVVLIPVSFLITVGDHFEEHIVKFGTVDDSKNEDFEHPGQSVTQHCKAHVFYLDRGHGKKLCIIDTPGFGDTRGLDQDDYNMTHILEYIKGLSHLNAVCFLLKPNESRLNIFFRTCLSQLFSLLGPNIARNILFCFTNSRSTFYTPGNTAPLLKSMLASLSKVAVSFKKENTFCFDSESFRYLVSVQNQIAFSEIERSDYEKSWINSVDEANRLVRYIRTNLHAYRISD